MVIGRILIVDDEIEEPTTSDGYEEELLGYMAYYVQALRDKGFDVVTATGADQALAKLHAQGDFDLVILDLMMPPGQTFTSEETALGMRTGMRLAEQIHLDYPTAAIVILSNNVPCGGTGSPRSDCQKLVDSGVVKRVFFKPDTTPFDFVEHVACL